jgi:flagellar biosynthesis/type III secretory pathway M-ring protein FliF/YscJ
MVLQVAKQLGHLNLSQRLVFVLLSIIMVGAAFWLVQWTSERRYIPLLDQSFTPAELTRVSSKLDQWNTKYKVEDQRVLVLNGEHRTALAKLQQAEALPKETWIGFSQLLEQNHAFLTSEESSRRWNVALSKELGDTLSMWDKVKWARVLITPAGKRRFGEPDYGATASVHLELQPGVSSDRNLVEAVANSVAAGVRGLKPDAVKIVDSRSGKPLRVPDPDDPLGSDMLAKRTSLEQQIAGKIESILPIDGLLVQVNVELETETKKIEDLTVGKPQPSEIESKKTESNRGRSSGEPGVQPNVGLNAAEGGVREVVSEKTTREKLGGLTNQRFEVSENIPGAKINWIAATIGVPHSHFHRVHRIETSDPQAEPSEAELAPLIQREIDRIKNMVEPLVRAGDPGEIKVDMYWDAALASSDSPLETPEASSAISKLVSRHPKQIALGFLAAGSLFLMAFLARKSGVELGDVDSTPGHDGKVSGDGGGAGGINLDDVEIPEAPLDVDALVRRKVSKRVGEMVASDPDMAAGLVRRWLSE